MPKVSIVIPVYNCERTIARTLDSVKEQTFKDFEVIIVDNNCTDNTVNIVKQYFDYFYVNIVDCKDKGIVPALNTGMREVKGELIARLDGDDVWYPEKIEKQVKFLDENPEISILGTQIRLLDVDGNVEELGTFGNKIRYPTDDSDVKALLLHGQNPICHPAVIFRKSVLNMLGGYEQLFPLAEDLHLWCRAIPHFKFSNLDEVLMDYTQTKGEDYDARIPLVIADMYYDLYKKAGIVQGERRKLVYDWQMKKGGHKHRT